MRSRASRLLLAPVVLVTFAALALAAPRPVTAQAAAQPDARLDAQPDAQPGATTNPLTERHLETFAKAYENAVNRRDASAINERFGLESLLKRSFEGLDLPAHVRSGFSEGVRDGFDWGASLAHAMGEEGHYHLLSTRIENGEARALFRLVNNDGGLNYHDSYVGTRADGSLAIVDAYVFLSGENLSKTIRRSLDEALAGEGAAHIAEIGQAVNRMAALVRGGDYEAALQVYEELPADARENKTIMIMRVTCAVQVGPGPTTEACSDFRRLFPGDACIDLVTFDQLVFQKRWDEALAALGRIGKAVGDDPYLDDLSASVLIEAGRLDKAKTLGVAAIEREPTLEEPYWTMLSIALLEKNHAATAKWLTALQNKFTYIFPDLTGIAEYEAFTKSSEYGAWRAAQVASVEE